MTDTHSALGLVKRYAILGYGTIGTMGDVGLMVLGSLLVGLSIAVLLEGFGIVDAITEEISTGATLISAIVLAVVGLFCLGVASEGPLGRGRQLVGFQPWEMGIGRTLAVFVAGLLGLLVYQLITGALDGVPIPVVKGVEGIRAVSVAGMTVMPLLGVPLSLLARMAPDPYAWARPADIPIMFVVWTVGTMVIL
ncbi:MAG TPA: hypothetical protein VGB33_00685 [Acidimicrobiia bacterium]